MFFSKNRCWKIKVIIRVVNFSGQYTNRRCENSVFSIYPQTQRLLFEVFESRDFWSLRVVHDIDITLIIPDLYFVFLSVRCYLSIQPFHLTHLTLSVCTPPPPPPTHSLQMPLIALHYSFCFPLPTSLHSPPTQSTAVKPFSLPLSSISSSPPPTLSSSVALFICSSSPHFYLLFGHIYQTIIAVSLPLSLCLSVRSVRGQVEVTAEWCDSYSHFYSDILLFLIWRLNFGINCRNWSSEAGSKDAFRHHDLH